VHNGFVEIENEKMSKSLGNVLLVQNLLQRFPGEAIRLALLKGRYREPISWSESLIGEAKSQLDRLYGALRRLRDVTPSGACAPNADFAAAMDDDLNSPQALAVLMELVTRANVATDAAELGRLKAALLGGGYELGILQQDPEQWFSYAATGAVDVARVEALIAARTAARAAKHWAEADRLRAELGALGVVIEDGAQGTTWRTA
jgi:cysteinyl-tRNA synthetase